MFTIFFSEVFAEFSAIFRLKALRCMETLNTYTTKLTHNYSNQQHNPATIYTTKTLT